MARKRRIMLAHKALKTLDLPEEANGVPKLTLYGRQRVLMENHIGILQYREDEVRLRTACGVLCIRGGALCLRELSAERLYVEGNIDVAAYEQ